MTVVTGPPVEVQVRVNVGVVESSSDVSSKFTEVISGIPALEMMYHYYMRKMDHESKCVCFVYIMRV